VGFVLSLPIYRGWEQQELGDKGTGSGRAGHGKQEVLIPCSPHRIGTF